MWKYHNIAYSLFGLSSHTLNKANDRNTQKIPDMIQTAKELEFYIRADYMMNRGYFKPSFKQRLRDFFP